MPTVSMSAKFLVVSGPKKKSARSTKTTVSEVLIERTIVWFKLFPTVSSNGSFVFISSLRRRFSRTRSNTTMVSFMEIPSIAKSATTKSESTSAPRANPRYANTPIGTSMSCTRVTMAMTAYFQEETGFETLRKAKVMKARSASTIAMIAAIALLVSSLPIEGPIAVKLFSVSGALPESESARSKASFSAVEISRVRTRRSLSSDGWMRTSP